MFAENVQLPDGRLGPIAEADADLLGTALAEMEPWSRLSFSPSRIKNYLLRQDDPAARRYILKSENETAGVVVVRHPWLRGPYLELLAILPAYQGRGMGCQILNWFETSATGQAENIWVAASSFNERAIKFYKSFGFEKAAILDELSGEGFDELLLRKRLR